MKREQRPVENWAPTQEEIDEQLHLDKLND